MIISLPLCFAGVTALVVCILVMLKILSKIKSNYDALEESYHNLEQLNSTLRAQRHDYLNHLQVVYFSYELSHSFLYYNTFNCTIKEELL